MSSRLALKASLNDPQTVVPAQIPPSKCQHRANPPPSSRRTASRCLKKENVAPAVSRKDRLEARHERIDIARHRAITTRTAEQEDELFPLEIEESLPDNEGGAGPSPARAPLDRANRGLTPKELEDTIFRVAPHLSRKQISNHRTRYKRKTKRRKQY